MKKKKETPPDLEAKLASLPDNRRRREWTPEVDRLILKFCPTKGVPAVAAVLRIPVPTVQNRYDKLRQEARA